MNINEIKEIVPGDCEIDFASFEKLGENPKANSKITYRYTCAGNFKHDKTVILKGPLLEKDLKMMFSNLFDGEKFITEQVGLPRIAPTIDSDEYDEELDHDCHHFLEISLTLEDADMDLKAKTFADRFRAISKESDWDFSLCEKSIWTSGPSLI